MTRHLRVLGLALVAVLALSSMIASMASANNNPKFTASSYPQHIFGEDTEADDSFTALGNVVQCTSATFTGNLTAANNDLTVTPTYTGCTSGARPSTVTTNGCTYTFTVEHTNAAGTDHTGSVHIVCPAGKNIEIHTYTEGNHTSHSGVLQCTVTVFPQTLTGVTYRNVGHGHVEVEGSEEGKIPGVDGQAHGSCTFGFTIGFTDGVYDAGVTVEGTTGTVDVG